MPMPTHSTRCLAAAAATLLVARCVATEMALLPTVHFEGLVLVLDPKSGGIVRIEQGGGSGAAAVPWFVNETADGALPLWRLTFADGGISDSTQCGAPVFLNQSRQIEWTGCHYHSQSQPKLEFDVTVAWSAAKLPPRALSLSRVPPTLPFGVEGRIHVSGRRTTGGDGGGGSSPVLSTVIFPILRLRPLAPVPPTEVELVWSRESGRSWRNPWADNAPVGYGVGTQAGSPGPTQMGCIVNRLDEEGLYWATHDPAVSQKHFYYVNNKTKAGMSNGIVEASIGHVYPVPLVQAQQGQEPQPALDFSLDYPVVLTTFRGDWWDAAQLYRSWALRQPWVPAKETPGNESWLKKTHVWVRGDTKHRPEVSSVRATLLKYTKLFGTPLGVQLYDWANASTYHAADGSTSSSFTFPSRWPPQDGWNWTEMREQGIRVLPYVNSEASNTGDANWVSDNGEGIAIRDRLGHTISVGDNGSKAICASQTAWGDRLVNASVRLVDAGASGIYMDQSGNQAQMPCYASDHNHSLGGGSYGSEGLVRIFGSVQRAVRAVDPEAMLAGEVPPEELLSTIDLRLLHFNYWPGWVPLEQSIYSGYTTSFGRTIVLRGPEAADAGLKTRVANMLHSGSTFGRLWIDRWADAAYRNQTRYLQQHIGFRRALSRFFVHGALLRPVKTSVVAGPPTVSLVPAKELKGHNLTLSSCLTSLWLSEDGLEMGLMISNLAEKDLEVAVEVELQRTWLAAAATGRHHTLSATKLEYAELSAPLKETPLCVVPAGKAACGTFVPRGSSGELRPFQARERLAAGAAVFLKLGLPPGLLS